MALLNRFSKLNDRGETGIFTFIVTKSVTRDFHRDATTKDFCFGYHRWAISFQRPSEKVLGVHLLLRNPSPNTACVVDFSLALLNREHFSQNEVYTKRQAKFTITNPMQGVSRWIQMSDLIDRHFSNETGEFLFELSLSNMTTIFECDIQLNPTVLTQYKSMLKNGMPPLASSGQPPAAASDGHHKSDRGSNKQQSSSSSATGSGRGSVASAGATVNNELINLETNYFTFGSFDWSLTIVPLVIPSHQQPAASSSSSREAGRGVNCSPPSAAAAAAGSAAAANSSNNLLTPNKHHSASNHSISSASTANEHGSRKSSVQQQQQQAAAAATAAAASTAARSLEPVCRVYLNRLSGFDCLCRVKYRVILGHHQPGGQHPAEFADSRLLDQISDSGGRIRGHQFRGTNILKLISLRSSGAAAATSASNQAAAAAAAAASAATNSSGSAASSNYAGSGKHHHGASSSLDLRVHIEMFCANTISEARVPLQRKPNEAQVSNCSDRNKQAWCVESDCESENVRLKLFFMDLQSVPRNHIRYISWIAYVVRRDSKSGAMKESLAVRNSPHSNYYLQDGIDMGTIMDTDIAVRELNNSPKSFLEANHLTVHIEWVDSLLLFSHLYNNYDALATIQRHQIRRELCALEQEFMALEKKYGQNKRALNQLRSSSANNSASGQPQQHHHRQQQQQQARQAADYSSSSPQSTSPSSVMSVQLASSATGNGPRRESKPDSLRSGSLGADGQMQPPPPSQQQHQQQHYATSSLQPQSQPKHLAQGAPTSELPVGVGVDAQRSSSSQLRGIGLSLGAEQWGASAEQTGAGGQMMGAHYQQQQQPQHKTPMSLDERLKFSSSTPPMGQSQQLQSQFGQHQQQQHSQLAARHSDGAQQQQQHHHQHHHLQHNNINHREPFQVYSSALSQKGVRRRLPQQPGAKQAPQQQQQQQQYQAAFLYQQRGGISLEMAMTGGGGQHQTASYALSSRIAPPTDGSTSTTATPAVSLVDNAHHHPSYLAGGGGAEQQQQPQPLAMLQDRRHTMGAMMLPSMKEVASSMALLDASEPVSIDRYHHLQQQQQQLGSPYRQQPHNHHQSAHIPASHQAYAAGYAAAVMPSQMQEDKLAPRLFQHRHQQQQQQQQQAIHRRESHARHSADYSAHNEGENGDEGDEEEEEDGELELEEEEEEEEGEEAEVNDEDDREMDGMDNSEIGGPEEEPQQHQQQPGDNWAGDYRQQQRYAMRLLSSSLSAAAATAAVSVSASGKGGDGGCQPPMSLASMRVGGVEPAAAAELTNNLELEMEALYVSAGGHRTNAAAPTTRHTSLAAVGELIYGGLMRRESASAAASYSSSSGGRPGLSMVNAAAASMLEAGGGFHPQASEQQQQQQQQRHHHHYEQHYGRL